MADLTITITESVTLNGAARGSTNSKTLSGVNDVFHRIVSLPAGTNDTTLVAFTNSMEHRDGALDRDLVKYIRITNLDGSNPCILNLQQREDENASAVGDQNLGLLLSAGKSFIMGEAADCIDVEGGANDIDAQTDLHDLESIMVDPEANAITVELFIALA